MVLRSVGLLALGMLVFAPGAGRAQSVNSCIDRCFSSFSPMQNGGSSELRDLCVRQCKPAGAFGAIAYGAKSLAFGYAFDKDTSGDAERTALHNCSANGGDCRIVSRFSNACAAVAAVTAKGRFATGQGRSQSQAQAGAIAACRAQGGGLCEIQVWTCAGRP